MRVGLRAKLAMLLTAVALLPLLAALVVMVVGSRKLRSETVAQSLLSVASTAARATSRRSVSSSSGPSPVLPQT